MTKPEPHVVERSIEIDARPEAVYGLVEDVGSWPQWQAPVVHVERRFVDATHDEAEIWALRGGENVRHWTARRTLDPVGFSVSFHNGPEPGPITDAGGAWRVAARDGGAVLTVRHEFSCSDAAVAESVAAGIDTHSGAQLARFKEVAEDQQEFERLTIGFEDPLFIGGTAEDSYELLYRADEWPDRFPHVTRIDMTEDGNGIQFFDMDTVTPDGRAHTTRSVRICFPHHKIVYKQISLAPLLTAHTGHWLFTETPEGTVASARHTATINPAALELLSPGATVADARAYLRRALSANSVANLRFAKEYAEGLADARRQQAAQAPQAEVKSHA